MFDKRETERLRAEAEEKVDNLKSGGYSFKNSQTVRKKDPRKLQNVVGMTGTVFSKRSKSTAVDFSKTVGAASGT